jgi:hypothetical protein
LSDQERIVTVTQFCRVVTQRVRLLNEFVFGQHRRSRGTCPAPATRKQTAVMI